MGEVVKRVMSEEERLAYIAKHPIKPTERPTGLQKYEWRGGKGRESYYGNKKG